MIKPAFHVLLSKDKEGNPTGFSLDINDGNKAAIIVNIPLDMTQFLKKTEKELVKNALIKKYQPDDVTSKSTKKGVDDGKLT